MNNTAQEFELLDILVIISFMIQIDDHNNSRDEFKYIRNKLEQIEKLLTKED